MKHSGQEPVINKFNKLTFYHVIPSTMAMYTYVSLTTVNLLPLLRKHNDITKKNRDSSIMES